MLLLLACGSPLSPLRLSGSLSETDPHAVLFRVSSSATVVCESENDSRSTTLSEQGVLRGLLADTSYQCHASAEEHEDSSILSFQTPPLPMDLSLPVVPNAADAGFHLLQQSVLGDLQIDGPVSGRYTVVYDAQGNPRWQYPQGGGDLDVSWIDSEHLLMGGSAMGITVPPMVLDLDSNIRWQQGLTVDWKGRTFGMWSHDTGVSYDGTQVLALVQELTPGVSPYAFGILFLNLETGEVEDYLDVWQSAAAAIPAPEGYDPYHPNAVWDDENYVYVNLRGASRTFCIDRDGGELQWWLGLGSDFRLEDAEGNLLPDEQWFFTGHDAKVIGDRYYLFDNGTERAKVGGENFSRVLVLKLDVGARIATVLEEWEDVKEGQNRWLAPVWGGVDPIPGGLSVAFSNLWWVFDQGPNAGLVHLDEKQNVTWRLRFEDPHVTLYRSEWSKDFPISPSQAPGQ